MQTTLAHGEKMSAQAVLQPILHVQAAQGAAETQRLLTFSNHVFVLESIFVCSFCGRVIVHPDFTVVAPVHRIGLPELRQQESQLLRRTFIVCVRHGPTSVCITSVIIAL